MVKIPDCPKKMNFCVKEQCPIFERCFAYDNFLKKEEIDSKRKDVGYRWHDTKFFTDKDRNRKNNWQPIEMKHAQP